MIIAASLHSPRNQGKVINLFSAAGPFVYCISDSGYMISYLIAFCSPLWGRGVPGQSPGECGRRIAIRYACPTRR